MDAPRTVLVPHTHWDREWYQPFEAFLARLLAMMDGLIDLLDRDGRFGHFHLDGQVSMIDDYLAVRPEREPAIRRLARAGRVSVGPWYTQMDEFLVSGESLVRNLEWGLRRGRELAGDRVLLVGYLPDQFGHVGQMPQILRMHGIERAVVWRGVPSAIDRTPFRWEAPDGTAVTAEYLVFGYSLGAAIGAAEAADSLRAALDRAVELLSPVSARDRLLVTVGSDHTGPAARIPALLEEVDGGEGGGARIGSIAGFLEGPDPPGVPVWRGELRSAARAHLLPGVYSTRAHQKRARGRVEALLERYAEPLAALVPGVDWPERDLARAWRLLLWNGAHDSVCGCSVDGVARDVDSRYREAEAIARSLVDRSMAALAARVPPGRSVSFNPSPFEREGVPGLGWRVDAQAAVAAPDRPHARTEGGAIVAGGFGFRLVDEGDLGDLYNFAPSAEHGPREPAGMDVEEGTVVARFDGVEVRVSPAGPADPADPADALRVRIRVANRRPDHRLRLHVALDRPAEESFALSAFEVVRRAPAGEGGTETPSRTWPAGRAVLAGGVAVMGEGVFEYEVLEDPPELAVTLLRCVGTISRPSIPTRAWAAGPDIATPEAQMRGELELLLALRRGLRPEDLPEAWERAMLPLLSVPGTGTSDLADSGSFLEVRDGVLSSIRSVEGALEVRVWNPSGVRRAARVAGRDVALRPHGIATVRLG